MLYYNNLITIDMHFYKYVIVSSNTNGWIINYNNIPYRIVPMTLLFRNMTRDESLQSQSTTIFHAKITQHFIFITTEAATRMNHLVKAAVTLPHQRKKM